MRSEILRYETSFSWLAREIVARRKARKRHGKAHTPRKGRQPAPQWPGPSRSERRVMETGELIGKAVGGVRRAFGHGWNGLRETWHGFGASGHRPHAHP